MSVKTSAFALALSAAALLAACSPARSTLFAEQTPAGAPAPQIEVLQGDVLVIDGRHLHLVDAATPKPAPHARCMAEALASRQARLRLLALVQGVRKVVVSPTGSVDDHNRAEARVLLDGVDPAQVLIDEGLAVQPQGRPFDWCGPVADALPQGSRIAMLSLSGS
jgi:endonuclease YncB( thermonuclease family)